MRMSKSKVLTYIDCPRRYKFSYIQEIPFVNKYFEIGKTVHSALDKFFDILPDEIKEPEKVFNETIKQAAGGSYEKYKHLYDNFVKFEMKNFEAQPYEWYRPFRREIKMVQEGGGGTLVGVLDRVDYVPGKGFRIIDYKSGKLLRTYFKKNLFELSIYAYLFSQFYNRNDIYEVGIYGVKNNCYMGAQITNEHIEEALRIVGEVRNMIKDENFEPNFKSCWKYGGCPYMQVCKKMKEKENRKKLQNWEVDK